MDWIQLTELSQLQTIIKESESGSIAIFKHSTSCGISRMVLKGFEKDAKNQDISAVKLYFLDLLRYRSISNEIANLFDVVHESPQLLVIKNGAVKHHSSHSSISSSVLSE